jgi:PHP family Zn ribbon phosphoesterase
VKQSWEALLAAFGTEVNVLVDVPIADFYAARYNVDERVVEAIKAFRAGEIRVIPGGGGRYGVIDLKSKTSGEEQGRSEEIVLKEMSGRGQNRQLSLLDF